MANENDLINEINETLGDIAALEGNPEMPSTEVTEIPEDITSTPEAANSETPEALAEDIEAILNAAEAVEAEAILESIPLDEVAAEEPVIEEAPIEEPVLEETPVEETPIEEISIEETSVDELSVEEIPVEEPILEDTPIEEPQLDEISTQEIPAEEPVLEDTPIEEPPLDEPVLEDTPIEEAPVEEISLDDIAPEEPTAPADEPVSFEEPPVSTARKMSVEEIASQINDAGDRPVDVSKYLELSIGENGSSYVAIRLNTPALEELVGISATDDLPVMISGNCLNIACRDKIIKKNLFTGAQTSKDSSEEMIHAINHSIDEVSKINMDKLDVYPDLSEVLDMILRLSDENIASLNEKLADRQSTLKIETDDSGAKCVLDKFGVVHSLQEVLWVLSL